jgi:ABC-type transport system involved in multi-copper enzyme maturation permease subunit
MTAQTTERPAPQPAEDRAEIATRRPRLVVAELRKILTTSSWWIIGIFVLVATGLALLVNVSGVNQSVANAELLQEQQRDGPPGGLPPGVEVPTTPDIERIVADGAAQIFTSGQFFGLLLVAIVGALVVTNEFQHQTATATFLTTPQRTRVITAKFVAAVIAAGAYWLFGTALSVGIGALDFLSLGYGIPFTDSTVLRAVGMNLLAYGVWAVLGVGFGVLLRSQLGATLTTTGVYLGGWPALLLFSLLHSIIQEDWVYDLVVLMPGVASMIMVQTERLQLGFDTYGPPWWAGAITLVAYGAISGVIGTLIMRQRDVS